jgi:hypothetical protein
MSTLKYVMRATVIVMTLSLGLFAQDSERQMPKRDAQSIEILKKVVQAAGGEAAVAAVRDITERGEVTFYWSKREEGPVTILMIGGSRYRMEAELPERQSIWVVRDGAGWKKEAGAPVVGISS